MGGTVTLTGISLALRASHGEGRGWGSNPIRTLGALEVFCFYKVQMPILSFVRVGSMTDEAP